MFQGKRGEPPLRRIRGGAGGLFVFIFNKSQGFINGFQSQVQVFLGVSVTDIAVVEGREEKAFPNYFGAHLKQTH
jgi:hypothetical protein